MAIAGGVAGASPLRIGVARSLDEVRLILDWAAAEGWNPGLSDAEAFVAADPEGFLLGRLGSEPVAAISLVRYDDRFAFLGCYIVTPELRGRGHGIAMWRAAVERAEGRTIGLDGVPAQQASLPAFRLRAGAAEPALQRAGARPAQGGPAHRRARRCQPRAVRGAGAV